MEMNMGHHAFLLSSYLFFSLGQISLACFVVSDNFTMDESLEIRASEIFRNNISQIFYFGDDIVGIQTRQTFCPLSPSYRAANVEFTTESGPWTLYSFYHFTDIYWEM